MRSFLLTLIVLLGFGFSFAGGYLYHQTRLPTAADLPLLTRAYEILTQNGFKPPPPPPALEYGMIRGMLQAYDDPYTIFVEPAQHELETNTLEGSFGGIGVTMDRNRLGQVVLHPLPDSPASRIGIQDGDILIAIDARSITPEMSMELIQALLRGRTGSSVKLTVLRPPDLSPLDYSLKRAEITLPSTAWYLAADEPRLGVIRVNIISANTPDEIKRAVAELSSRHASAFALDLRDNTGGLLEAAVEVARLFLKDGVVILEQYRDEPIRPYRVEHPGALSHIPLTVLVNENTASAAEIIAGALKQHGRARLIGSHTYGKGSVQLVFDLQDGSSLHVTAAHWWFPGQEPLVHGKGLEPDIDVAAKSEPDRPDAVLQAAISLLFQPAKP